MSELARRAPRFLFPEISELFDGLPFGGMRPVFDTHLMRLEDEMTKDGRYEVRAEIPGVDPAKDVDITVRDGRLTIKAERTEKSESKARSEFAYGSFVRTVSLPPGADENDITATYGKGVLTISVPVSKPKDTEKRIPVQPSK
jgi:HSP20 family molecular chaperone IbpA